MLFKRTLYFKEKNFNVRFISLYTAQFFLFFWNNKLKKNAEIKKGATLIIYKNLEIKDLSKTDNNQL